MNRPDCGGNSAEAIRVEQATRVITDILRRPVSTASRRARMSRRHELRVNYRNQSTFVLGDFRKVAGLCWAAACVLSLCNGWIGIAHGQVEIVQPHVAMGVEFRLIAYAESEASARHAIRLASLEIDAADRVLSDYKSDSELSQLMQRARVGEWQDISPRMWTALRRSLELSRATHGAFDITIGPASRLWRGAIRRHRLPNAAHITAMQPRVGFQKLELSPEGSQPQVRLLQRDMQLDFGGIGKGLAADWAIAAARLEGVHGLLIDASGDIAVWGRPVPREGWRIALPTYEEIPERTFEIAEGAVATSGDWNQALLIDGQRYSHIVDPRTLWATSHSCRVTVWANDGAAADAWATALAVFPPDEALELAEITPGLEAMIVSREENSGLRVRCTKNLPGN